MMRRQGTHGTSKLLQQAARLRPGPLLATLSLALAAFALVLQLSSRYSVERTQLVMTGGAERDLMAQQIHHPKLEINLAEIIEKPPRQQAPKGLGVAWKAEQPKEAPRIAFVVTTSDSLQQIRVWISYHRAIGVTTFYIFADGQAARADNVAVLRELPGVTVVLRDAELKRRHEASRIWKESWLSAFFHKPCNHELFVLQSLNMEVGIEMAQKDKVDWLLHVDTDEMIYPSGSLAFSLQEVLGKVPADVDTLVFPNYESLPEREDVADPFLEVSLFKKNYAHVVSDLYFKSYGTVARGNPNYFITYGNGKSAARVQQGMRPNGAHRWHSYVKTPKEWSSDQAAVLHFTYNRFSDLKSRRDRCDCAPTEEDAKRCFILPFDRMAFLEASLKNDKELMEWFRQRLVWSDPAVVNDLLKKGLFMRIYEPQVMIRGFLEAERAAESKAGKASLSSSGSSNAGTGAAASGTAIATVADGSALAAAQKAAAVGDAQAAAGTQTAAAGAGAGQQAGTAAATQQQAASDAAAAAVGTAASSELGAVQKAAAVGGQQAGAAQQAAEVQQAAAFTAAQQQAAATTVAQQQAAATTAAQQQAAATTAAQQQAAATTGAAGATADTGAAAVGTAASSDLGAAQKAAVLGVQQEAAGAAQGLGTATGADATATGAQQQAAATTAAAQQQQAAAGADTGAAAVGTAASSALGAAQQAAAVTNGAAAQQATTASGGATAQLEAVAGRLAGAQKVAAAVQ